MLINNVPTIPTPSLVRNDRTPTPHGLPAIPTCATTSSTMRIAPHPRCHPQAARNSPAALATLAKALHIELSHRFNSLRKVSNVDVRAHTEAAVAPYQRREDAARVLVNAPAGSSRTQADSRQAEDEFWKAQHAGTSGLA